MSPGAEGTVKAPGSRERAEGLNREGPKLTAEVEGLRAQVRERVEVLQAHEREFLRLRDEFDELKRDVDPSLKTPQFEGWRPPSRVTVYFALDKEFAR